MTQSLIGTRESAVDVPPIIPGPEKRKSDIPIDLTPLEKRARHGMPSSDSENCLVCGPQHPPPFLTLLTLL
jgi:hypothetical protein